LAAGCRRFRSNIVGATQSITTVARVTLALALSVQTVSARSGKTGTRFDYMLIFYRFTVLTFQKFRAKIEM
jgi:hypothetical protein